MAANSSGGGLGCLVVLLGVAWLLNAPGKAWLLDEVTVYHASCSKGGPVIPSTVALRDAVGGATPFNVALAKYEADIDSCEILPAAGITYKLNRARGEVAYLSLGQVRRLTNCAFVDRRNWSCSYRDGSGSVTILDGLQAYTREEVLSDLGPPNFSLRRWQWWAATIVGYRGAGPTGSWLIPEQAESFP